jgi:2'-5' RNA ligase
MENTRCFIAIELPPELKAELTRLQNKLRSAPGGNSARWVASDGIHLTLIFLGNVPTDKIPAIMQVIEEAARETPELRLEIDECGCFPNNRRPQVIWVGLSGDIKILDELVNRLERSLARLGFKPEGRPFTPHLTLARMRDTATPGERQAIGEAISKTKSDVAVNLTVNGICLMQSELTPKGAIYTRLVEAKLKKNEKTG